MGGAGLAPLTCLAAFRFEPEDGLQWLERYREVGFRVVSSDNGPPVAPRGASGLSQLSFKVIKAGVVPERIATGKPQQNGRHERACI